MQTAELDRLAELAVRTNKHLLEGAFWPAQRSNNLLLQALRRAGAEDPVSRAPRSSGNPEIPLNLLDSPAARRYASAIRAAAAACREMETERGIEDGLTEQLECFAESAEMEVFGPVGLDGSDTSKMIPASSSERNEMLQLIHNMKLALPEGKFRREVDEYTSKWFE